MTQQLIPEWHPSEAVILAWPDGQTDWADWLEQVRDTYLALIEAINQSGATVIMLCRGAHIAQAKAYMQSDSKV